MADSWDSKEVRAPLPLTIPQPFKFTAYLRGRQRGGTGPSTAALGGALKSHAGSKLSYQQELKEIGKRNVQIKKSYELEKKGLLLNPYLFEREALLLRRCRDATA